MALSDFFSFDEQPQNTVERKEMSIPKTTKEFFSHLLWVAIPVAMFVGVTTFVNHAILDTPGQIDNLQREMTQMTSRMGGFDSQFENVNDSINVMNGRLNNMDVSIKDVNETVKNVEGKLDTGLAEMKMLLTEAINPDSTKTAESK